MGKQIVGVTIDKIKNYLYYIINSKMQESQNDDGTLQAIIKTSEFISTNFNQRLKQEFPEPENQSLIDCSGKYIFITTQDASSIRERLNQLFQDYYLGTDGQLLIKFVCLAYQEKEEELDSINRVTKALKKSCCLNKIIEENQAVLFEFPKRKIENTLEKDELATYQNDYPAFAKNINALALADEDLNPNHFRIAVIKADFDGMKALFDSLKCYETYKKISELLTEYVSINKLHEYTKAVSETVEQDITSGKANYGKSDRIPPFKIYPFYVAGDDIFFAVRIEHVFNGIELCKKLLQELDKELSTEQAYPRLSLSIGVEISFNREPIRYYYERVSEQLDDLAKKRAVYLKPKIDEREPQKDERSFSTLKVGFNGTVFLDIINEDEKENNTIYKANSDKERLYYFTQDVYRMNQAVQKINDDRKDNFAGKRFFYTLLQKLTDEKLKNDDKKYKNTLLYHLLPQTWESGNKDVREAEFKLLAPLIKKISRKKDQKNEKDLILDEEQDEPVGRLKMFENYVRLMVLFSDPRFKILVFGNSKNGFPKKLEIDGATILINRSMRYLYNHSLCTKNQNKLRTMFIQEASYDVPKKENTDNVQQIDVFRTLNIGTSTFYRLKKIEQQKLQYKEDQSKLSKGTRSTVKILEALPKRSEENDLKREYTAPADLTIDSSELSELLASEDWNENYIDSLLIFYKLKKLLITFKTQIKNKG